MRQETLDKIKAMDDFQVLRFFNHLNQSLIADIQEDSDSLLEELPDSLQQLDEMQKVLQLDEEFDTPLLQKEAADFARSALIVMAENEDTEPSLAENLNSYTDDVMAAGAILALGGAVSFIVLLSTHKISYKKGKGWELQGRNPGEIKEVTDLVKTLVSGIPDAVLKLIRK